MDDGKHDILPVAGFAPDHAVMPVTRLRQTDPDMCPAGYQAATMQHRSAPVSTEECTAHQNLTRPPGGAKTRRQWPLEDQHGRMVRWRERRQKWPRLRGQDKAPAPCCLNLLSAHLFSSPSMALCRSGQCRSHRFRCHLNALESTAAQVAPVRRLRPFPFLGELVPWPMTTA